MKTIVLFILCGISLCFCNLKAEQSTPSTKPLPLKVDSAYFKTHLQPIFQKKCSPCHFPGGKMYERMPFDKGETIINHETGILKRIKGEEEIALIKEFIQRSR